MQIKLKWVNRNVLPTVTRVYRTTALLPNDQLGAPLVELDGGITEWVDTTAVRGTTYYYVFGVVGGGTTYYSQSLKIEAVYNTGPGPSKIAVGDQELGFFGAVAAIDFFTAAEIQAFTGISGATPVTPLPTWDKWCRNGKILFIPKTTLSVNASFLTLYSAGLVFGTNDNGAYVPTGGTPTNQRRVITRGLDRFIIRAPTAADDRNNPTRVVADDATIDIRGFSEVADLMYPAINVCIPPIQRFPRLLSPGSDSASVVTSNRAGLAQEKYKAGFCASLPGNITNRATQQALLESSFTAIIGWRPVLELIQTDFVIGSVIL